MNKRRYLKKIGADGPNGPRLFGWTAALAAKNNMIECNKDGLPLVTKEGIEKAGGPSPMKIFELGMAFRIVGEKGLKGWLEENAIEINAMGVAVQGLVTAKWQKCFGTEKMPEACTFITSGNSETGEPVEPEGKKDHPVNMEG